MECVGDLLLMLKVEGWRRVWIQRALSFGVVLARLLPQDFILVNAKLRGYLRYNMAMGCELKAEREDQSKWYEIPGRRC